MTICFFNILFPLFLISQPINEFNIYLIDSNGCEHIWIYESDILSYDWDSHVVYIIPDSVSSVESRSIPCTGFVFKINDSILYGGATDLSYKSNIGITSPTLLVWNDGIPLILWEKDDVRHDGLHNVEKSLHWVRPNVQFFYFGEGDDKRNNRTLYNHLNQIKKLKI